MREIKFRAWDKENKCMVYDSFDTLCDVLINIGGSLFCPDTYYRGCEKAYTLLQYTGFKDKNGKDIYEGDILKRVGSESPSDTYPVVYDEVKATYVKGGWGGDNELWREVQMTELWEIEVIGNIYEGSP